VSTRNLAECLKLKPGSFETCILGLDHGMKKFWKTTILHHYTDHGYSHSRRIITYLEALLNDYPDLLNQKERFMLLASIYLHDIGMQSPKHAGLKKIYLDYTTEDIETVRECHHISSGKMILDSIKLKGDNEFGLRNTRDYVQNIATIATYHRKLDIAELEDTQIFGENIRLPLLAALMRLGDALDMDSRRVNLENLRRWDIPVESKFHWWSHHYVKSVHIEMGKLKIRFSFPEIYRENPIIEEFTKKIIKSIQTQLDEVYDLLFDYKVKLYYDIQVVDVDYSVEGVHEPIPPDLFDYVENLVAETNRVQKKKNVGVQEEEKKEMEISSVEHEDFREIHLFLDELNTMLDGDLLAVKRFLYPNSWKIGLAYHKYCDTEITYNLYPIPITRNDVQIKKIPTLSREHRIKFGTTAHYVENPIKIRPRKYAVDIIENTMNHMLENKLLNNRGSYFLSKEFVYAFIRRFYRQLGLEEKEQYNLSNVENAFLKFLPLWTEEASTFMVKTHRNGIENRSQLLYRKPFFDPDLLIMQIPDKELITIDHNVRKRLKRNDWRGKLPLGNDKFPFRLFVDHLSFLKTRGVEKINKVYVPHDFSRIQGRSGLIWNVFSPHDLEANLKIFFDNLPEVYEEIVSNNFPMIKEKIKMFYGASKTIVTFDAKDIYESHQDSPSYKLFHLKAENPNRAYEIQVYKEGDDSLPENLLERNPRDKFEINGIKYNLVAYRHGILHFIFDDLPMFNFVYGLITDNLKEYFNVLRAQAN